ncbi:alanine--tRNA ligase-related protein, partial [Streptomyces sp. NPDC056697]
LGDIKVDSKFIGYDKLQTNASVLAIVKDGQLVQVAQAGEEIQVILDETPFYAESGGQIADEGSLEGNGLKVLIKDVQKAPNGQNLHRAV